MSDLNWKRKEYDTWDEAFRGLVPAARQQSVRVAAYTQVLFLQACADSFGKNAAGGSDQMKTKYGDLAYKCGLYHQLGKALVPPEYQLLQFDFTDEEMMVYRKYTTDGRTLVATLQERGQRARERRRGEAAEIPTENIPWLMIRESCQQHMERWDGSGYPDGREGREISAIAQIVGIAKELDRMAAETKSENPFEEAYKTLNEQMGTMWSPDLVAVLNNAKSKCRSVYNKYIHYTMTVPKSIPLLEKTKDRPMGLEYKPMFSSKDGAVRCYEALPWFGAIANRPGETEGTDDIHEMLVRTGLIADMSFYFLYEAADTVYRMGNCKLDDMIGIVVNMLPGFYTLGTQLSRFNQLFEDQPIDKEKLMITLPEEVFLKLNKGQKEIIGRYLRSGVALVLDGYHPDKLDYVELMELGFKFLRLDPELSLKKETADLMANLQEKGFKLLGAGADTEDALAWQIACGVIATKGTLTGMLVDEENLIRDCLLREREHG